MNYLYWFKKYAWIDKVWKVEESQKPWDLLQISDDFYLVLWKEVSFFEQYPYWLQLDPNKTKITHKKLLNKQTLQLLHRMVYQRYSTYKNVVKLFLPEEIDTLMSKKLPKKNVPLCKGGSKGGFINTELNLATSWQTLIIFPDLRTLMNLTTEDFRKQDWVDTLLSTNTQFQKNKSWRNIYQWNTKVIIATHSEIFQNYKDLQKIIIFYPYKRYYSSQQDPRYKTFDVVKKLSEIWNCPLETIEN